MITEIQKNIIRYKNENPFMTHNEVADMANCSRRSVTRAVKRYKHLLDVPNAQALVKELSSLQKAKQRNQDIVRVERKKIRSDVRFENALESYGEALVEEIQGLPGIETYSHPSDSKNSKAIFQLSDAHFNELISMPNNTYDFTIASKRLMKYVHKAKQILQAYNVDDVLIAMTGDMINSDRRLDELLNQATNRAKATILSCQLLRAVIQDLNKDFNVSISCISGNESRKSQEYGASEIMITNNYDFMINEILRMMFKENEGIKFIDGHPSEQVIRVGDVNVLMIHGQQIRGDNNSTTIQKIKGKYADKGICVEYVIFGHLHSAQVCDIYARSSSICGANDYSDGELQFSSKASQNLHIISGKEIDVMKICLQDVTGVEGYPIKKDLEAYNAKSANKVKTLQVPII